MDNLYGKKVIVKTPEWDNVEGEIVGKTVDNYYLIELKSHNKLFMRRHEFEVIEGELSRKITYNIDLTNNEKKLLEEFMDKNDIKYRGGKNSGNV